MEEEFNPGVGRISLRRGKKKDGTNWVMFAGGAIAMAVSVAFGRKKILEEGAEAKETLTASESGRVQASQQEDDENVSLQTFEMVPNGTLQWRTTQLALPSTEAAFEFRSFKPKCPAPTDPSPPVTKFICQSSVTPEFSKDEVVQSDTQISPTLQSGVIARRSEVVSRLRQQIKSRDEIIYDMQTQLAEQDQMIAMHRNHSIDLQDCEQAISTKLFEANLEIQRLQRELMTQRAKRIVALDEEFIDYAVSEIRRQWVHPKDVEEIVLEARKLNEELEHLRREKEAKEKVALAKSRQCDLLSKRLSALTIELEEIKTAAHGKQRSLEAKEQEYLKLANVVQDLQRKLEIEARDKEIQERSMSIKLIVKRADVRNIMLGHNVERPIIPTTVHMRKYRQHLPTIRQAEKVQDANELEQAAKQQDLELETKELTKHQAKFAEHKSEMAKNTAKFHVQNIEDDVFNREVLQGAAFVFDHERKLAAQEKTAKETSLIIQQLSTSPQLSSPYNPPVQKAWRTVQETPQSSSSHNMHQEHAVIGSSDENFGY